MTTRNVLVVMPSVPAAARGDGFFLDIKMVEGLVLYARLWDGPVRCAIRAGDPGQIAFGRDYTAAELPFEVVMIDADATGIGALTRDAAVVLAAGDNHRDLQLPELTDVPVVFIIEYTLTTRLRIIAIEQGRTLAAFKNMVWTLLTERRRRRAFARSAGLQANGQPGYAAYRRSSPSILRYFDSRLSDAQQIAAPALAAKQAAMREGRPLRIVFSGRLEVMKGADHLVRVATELDRAGVPFTLDIYGDGVLRPAMQRAIEATALTDRVVLHGKVPFDQVLVPLMKERVDLFLCCHRQDDPSCTYLETLSCGVPIVGYDNAAFAGVLALGDVGIAVAMDDPAAAARAIATLAGDRPRLAAMADAAAAIGRAHSFERTFAARIDHLKAIARR
jgi:glycosyltransferase involved in cell wall biosynthesis